MIWDGQPCPPLTCLLSGTAPCGTRGLGDQARKTIALVEEMCDRYSVADLLFDQAYFAQQQGLLEEARHLALRVIDVAKQIGADHFYKRSMSLLRNVSM